MVRYVCQRSHNSKVAPMQNTQKNDQTNNKTNSQTEETLEKNNNSHTTKHLRHPTLKTSSEIQESRSHYFANRPADPQNDEDNQQGVDGLSKTQQQFVLKFCSQLASVIEACEHSESAEIEVGRRQINARQIKVKLQAERELTIDTQHR